MRAPEAFTNKVIERPIDISQLRATFSPVEPNLDIRFATDMKVPATTQIDHRVVHRLNRRDAIVFNLMPPVRQQLSIRKQRALHSRDARKTERSQRQIEQV